MKSYADISYAEEYFATRAFAENWSASDKKESFLCTASQMIAFFAIFPNIDGADYDSEPPEWLKQATCEQALYLVNLGKDPGQADKKTTLGVASSDGTVFDKRFAADVLSPICQRIIIAAGGAIAPGASVASRSIRSGGMSK